MEKTLDQQKALASLRAYGIVAAEDVAMLHELDIIERVLADKEDASTVVTRLRGLDECRKLGMDIHKMLGMNESVDDGSNPPAVPHPGPMPPHLAQYYNGDGTWRVPTVAEIRWKATNPAAAGSQRTIRRLEIAAARANKSI